MTMQVEVEQLLLRAALTSALRVAGKNGAMPIIQSVLLTAEGERLRVTSTNLAMGLNTWIPARVLVDGAVCVPAKTITEVVSSLSGLRVTLEERDGALRVECDRVGVTLKSANVADYPPVFDGGGLDPAVRLSSDTFRAMVDLTAFAAAKDESRPVLSGINVRINGDALTVASADGFRLALRSETLDRAAATPINVIVPASAMSEIARAVVDDDLDLMVTANGTQIIGRGRGPSGHIAVVSRLLEGQYPDLDRVIPKEHSTEAVVDRVQMLGAIRTAAIFARDNANIVTLKLDAGSDDGLAWGGITVQAEAAEVGDNTSVVPATVTGDSMSITFSAEFLAEVLGALKTEKVRLRMSGPLSPAVIVGVGLDAYTHVIMPMHSNKR